MDNYVYDALNFTDMNQTAVMARIVRTAPGIATTLEPSPDPTAATQ
jgi:hypothetical protein